MRLKVRPLTLAVPSFAFAVGVVATASVAFAASLTVTSARITTASSSVSIAETTCTLTASADAGLARDSQGTNYGSFNAMSVRNQGSNNQRRSILRFDLSTCSIPASALVRSATLTLSASSGPGSNRSYTAHRVTEAWGENTVTYQNQPAFNATATSTVATGAAPASLSWSVLADVSAFVTGTANNGWLIKDTAETVNPARETLFNSREAAANRPTLVIGYYP